jgi:iron complex outermembrane recepter protein
MMTNRLHGYAVSVAVATALGLAGPAHGQSAPLGDAGGQVVQLNEVIVTAERVQQPLQDVPISITVLNQQQLSGQNVSTTMDLVRIVPDLQADDEFGDATASFSIRGFQQAISTQPSVAVYFADAVVPQGGNVGEESGSGVAPGTFFDLQNVEVLKGPQGTLFGTNTDGGAVLLVPKMPTSQFGGYVQGGFGNYGMGQEQAVLNLPVTSNFRLRLDANRETRNGYLDNISGVGPGRFGDEDYTAVRLSALLDVGNVENYTVGSYNQSFSGGPAPQVFACNSAEATGATLCPAQLAYQQTKGPYATVNIMPSPLLYLKQYQVVNSTTWNASDALTVKNIANYGVQVIDFDSSLFGAFILPTPAGVFPLYASSSDSSAADTDSTNQYTVSDELQLHGVTLDNKLTWQGGAYLMRSGPRVPLLGTSSPNFLSCTNIASMTCAGPGIIDINTSNVHFRDEGIFAQATYKVLPKLQITGGIRDTWDYNNAVFHQTDFYGFPGATSASSFFTPPGPPAGYYCPSGPLATPPGPSTAPGSGCEQQGEQSSHAPTGLFNVQYNFTPDSMVFAKYARGYRQGGVAPFVANGFHIYQPEHVDDFEFGEKASFSGPVTGALDATAFYSRITDAQLLAGFTGPEVAPSSGIVNTGTSRIYGIEVESTLQPVRPLSMYLSWAYLNATLVTAEEATLPPGSPYTMVSYPAVPGGQLPFAPRNKITGGADYQFPVPQAVGAISVGVNYTWTAAMNISAANAPYAGLPGYGLLGANAYWNGVFGSRIDLQFFATNLTNKVYYNDLEPLFDSPFGFTGGYLGEPRMYGMQIRVRFGNGG